MSKNEITIQRPQLATLERRLQEKRRFIQILLGPRQVGKTTLIHQALARAKFSFHFETADDKQLGGRAWIEEQWQFARTSEKKLLVLDEIQKIEGWSEVVKRCWDEDTRQRRDLKVVLLGSSALILEKGLTESLAGRFEIMRVPHWSFIEMKEAFGVSIEEFIFFGGYPGTAALFEDFERWRRMLQDSLIETTLSKDILLHARIEKPAVLRRLFQLACEYCSQILSYQKMVGQLQDVGNTTTLTHYLSLLNSGVLCTGLQKFEGKKHRIRSSIPKLQTYNTALISAQAHYNLREAMLDTDYWGRLVESAVGAHLLNAGFVQGFEVFYWREANHEVDFVLQRGTQIVAIEVKSGRRASSVPGVEHFLRKYPKAKVYLVGTSGIKLEEFFELAVEKLF